MVRDPFSERGNSKKRIHAQRRAHEGAASDIKPRVDFAPCSLKYAPKVVRYAVAAIFAQWTPAQRLRFRMAARTTLRVSEPGHNVTMTCSTMITAASNTTGQARERPTKQFFSALCSRRLPSSLSSVRAIDSLGRSTTSRKRQPA